jgi:hypothetical protein
VGVLVNPPGCRVPTQNPDSWITITQEIPDRGLRFRIAAAANSGAASPCCAAPSEDPAVSSVAAAPPDLYRTRS